MTTRALLPDRRLDLAAYSAAGGYSGLEAAPHDPEKLRVRLGACNLTGLGGAHFSFGRKLQLALGTPGPRVVVCNAAEDEPGSLKDRTLLERNPHCVIEGALIAASAIEAGDVYLYVSEGLTAALDSLHQALAELSEWSRTDLPALRVVKAPAAYVAGEASAAIRAIGGEEAKPGEQPPYPTESGVRGRPTLVSNCETLANLPRIVSSVEDEQWTRLATVTGDVAEPGVFEIVPGETTFADVISLAGGLSGPRPVLKAVQPGGPSSAYLSASAADVLLTNADIVAAGAQPGCLAIRVLSESRCLVEELAELTAFFAREQCGQCPACRMKTQAYAKSIDKIQRGEGDWSILKQLDAVDDFVSDMPRRCALISMPTAPVASAAALFRGDFEAHIDNKRCNADR
jgi:NADH-quinone oxidoreductase subunit F